MISIYALYSQSSSIRYVGKTRNVESRLAAHLRGARKGLPYHRHAWIRSVLSAGETLEIVVLDSTDNNDEANRLEKYYISFFRSNGYDLTNVTEGGDGQSHTYKPTLETIQKITEAHYRRPIERELARRAKISAGLKGKKKTPEHIRNASDALRGRSVSEECKRKIRELALARGAKPPSRKGCVTSEETKLKLSKFAREKRQHMVESLNALVAITEATNGIG